MWPGQPAVWMTQGELTEDGELDTDKPSTSIGIAHPECLERDPRLKPELGR